MSTQLNQNVRKARALLERFEQEPLAHWIDGARHFPGSGNTFANHAPLDGRVLNRVAAAGTEEVGLAAEAASRAFAPWRDTPVAERQRVMHRLAALIDRHGEDLALIESVDTGQPIRFTAASVRRAAEHFRFFADRAAEAEHGIALPSATHIDYSLRQPIGPAAVITPWNTPFMLAAWKAAPAIAIGCPVVLKPAEWSPLTSARLAELAADAGLPPGVLNVVHGCGETAGRALTAHPAIRAIAFVGESATGSAIMAQGAATLKRLHFELGGKNAMLVFADADLERALDAVITMAFSLNGERCTASSRLLVERSLHERFVERVAERARSIRVGPPLDPRTDLGPLIHADHFAKVRGHVDAACAEGAKLVAGGQPRTEIGDTCFAATVLTDVSPSMRIEQEEVFGPVLTVTPFDTEAEAIRLANGVRYGLAAYAFTRDVGRAHRLARALEAGVVWVNTDNRRHPYAPFGGMKASGLGRDGGLESFAPFVETKNVCVGLDLHEIPVLGRAPSGDDGHRA